jgi:hypothetical protein
LSINKFFYEIVGDLLKKGYDEIIVIVNRRGLINHPHAKVRVIEPSRLPLKGNLDTKPARVHQTIEQGRKDAQLFLQKINIR